MLVGELRQKIGVLFLAQKGFYIRFEHYNQKNFTQTIAPAFKSSAKKYRNVGYNKATLAFIEAGGDNTKNTRTLAVEAVKRNFSRRDAATNATMPNLEYLHNGQLRQSDR